jgi:putative sporulation protein YtaF
MIFASLLFGISASLDALLVGISYGIRQVRIRFWQNMIISLVTLLGTCLSVGLGRYLTPFLPKLLRNCAGSLILILLGLYYIIKWTISLFRSRKLTPSNSAQLETASAPTVKSPSGLKITEVLTLSLTLSLNNLSAGLSASLGGLTLLPTAVSTLICSVLFLFTGNRLGRNPMLQLVGCAADPLSGLLLIGLGLVQLIA